MARPWRIRVRRIDGDNCNHLSTDPCARCEAERLIYVAATPQAPAIHFFGEHKFEHMYDPWEPVPPISSPEVLRQEADKRGVQSQYLQDSLVFKSGPQRWV